VWVSLRAIQGTSRRVTWSATLPLYALIFLTCLAPLLWMAWQLAAHPHLLGSAHWSKWEFSVLGRTLLYNCAAAILATLMALPAAVVIGRGRGWLARILLVIIPIGLVMPSITYTYGWLCFFDLIHVTFVPAEPKDVIRCIWTLACWLWPLPAIGIGFSLRFLDSEIQQQAVMDGRLWRITWRQLSGAIIASLAMVCALSIQEFAVYEKSGISVISVEARTVFETGAFSYGNPSWISQPNLSGSAITLNRTDQASRASAALAASIPMLLIVGGLTLVAFIMARKTSPAETLGLGTWPRLLDAGPLALGLTAVLILVTLGTPTISMIAALSPGQLRVDSLGQGPITRVWRWADDYVLGSLTYGSLTGVFALALAILACIRRSGGLLALALLAFLIGGELLAIADIRLYNRTAPWPVSLVRVSGHDLFGLIYNRVPVMIIAYLGRFAWLALLAGNSMWSRPFAEIRGMASVDGAGPWRCALHAIVPIAWPVLLACGILVMVLSMTEVSASVLLSPQRPQMLVPTLMGWVHYQRWDQMIQGSLLLMSMVALLALSSIALATLGLRLSALLRKQGGAR
jgi:ABC-type Fe3+ transport system permease subunit